jgi:hypothetical protein
MIFDESIVERVLCEENRISRLKLEEFEIRLKEFNKQQTLFDSLFDSSKHLKMSQTIGINIGGKFHETNREELSGGLDKANNLFSKLLSGRWDAYLPRDSDGYAFFDFDNTWIECFFEYLREFSTTYGDKNSVQLVKPNLIDSLGHKSVGQLFEWFTKQTIVKTTPVGNLLGLNSSTMPVICIKYVQELISNKLLFETNTFDRQPVKLRLVYRATRDGFTQANFSDSCGTYVKQDTLCCVHSCGKSFVVYTHHNNDFKPGVKSQLKSFLLLFTLTTTMISNLV